MARQKKLKARPRESIHEIRAAGRESERKARFYSLCPAGAEEKNTRIGKMFFPIRSDRRKTRGGQKKRGHRA